MRKNFCEWNKSHLPLVDYFWRLSVAGATNDDLDHRFASHHDFDGRRFVLHDRFFRVHRRFFVGFDFIGFGLPFWWYPDYYYGYYRYPYDYASYGYEPIYDYRNWYGLGTAVQSELTRRSYYRGPLTA